MKIRTIIAVAAVSAVAAPAAHAQTPPDPVGGGTDLVGHVPSYLELILGAPTAQLSSFSQAKTYSTSFVAQMIATDGGTELSIADGDVSSGKKLGHLASGAKRLPLPLQARVGKGAFQPLDQSVDPLLTHWSQAGTRLPATVSLRQQVKSKASGSFRKVLLVTLSTDTP